MKGTLYIIPADNVEPVTALPLTATPELETLQKAVEGSIETLPYFDTYKGEPCVAYCNEEGKLEGLHLNERATLEWLIALGSPDGLDDYCAGDIVVITGDAELMASL